MAEVIELPGAHIAIPQDEQVTRVTPEQMVNNMLAGTKAIEIVSVLQPEWLLPLQEPILQTANMLLRALRNLEAAEKPPVLS